MLSFKDLTSVPIVSVYNDGRLYNMQKIKITKYRATLLEDSIKMVYMSMHAQ